VLPFEITPAADTTNNGDVNKIEESNGVVGEEDEEQQADGEDNKDELLDKRSVAGNSKHSKHYDINQTVSLPPPYQSTVWNEQSGQYVQASERLAKFYRLYNKVLLDNIAINKERSRLAEENSQLEDLIAQYTEGLALSHNILQEDNPLFVINGRANLNHVPPVRALQHTVQEATVISSTRARQYA
jgi:hypothetical protein